MRPRNLQSVVLVSALMGAGLAAAPAIPGASAPVEEARQQVEQVERRTENRAPVKRVPRGYWGLEGLTIEQRLRRIKETRAITHHSSGTRQRRRRLKERRTRGGGK